MSSKKNEKKPMAAPRLDEGKLIKFKWNNNSCECSVLAPRVGYDVPEPWNNSPDVVGRPPMPSLRSKMNELVDFCYKHREAAKQKTASVVVTGIQVKYDGQNVGYKVFAHRNLRNKSGQVVNFDSPGFVWYDHKAEGLKLTNDEAILFDEVVSEIMEYVTGKKSSQLSLMDEFEAKPE